MKPCGRKHDMNRKNGTGEDKSSTDAVRGSARVHCKQLYYRAGFAQVRTRTDDTRKCPCPHALFSLYGKDLRMFYASRMPVLFKSVQLAAGMGLAYAGRRCSVSSLTTQSNTL